MAITKKVIQKQDNLKGKKEGSKAPKKKAARTETPTVVLAEESEKEEEVNSVSDRSESEDEDDSDTELEETDSDHCRKGGPKTRRSEKRSKSNRAESSRVTGQKGSTDKSTIKKKTRGKRMRYESSSSSSDESESSSDSDSDGYEEDLDILKPLIPGRWPRSQGRMKRSLKDFVEDIHKRDPRRPQYLVEELNQVVSFVRSLHQDLDDDEVAKSKTAAKLFQAMATAYVRSHGGKGIDLKSALAQLRRRDRKNPRLMLACIRKVLKTLTQNGFRRQTNFRQSYQGPKNAGNTSTSASTAATAAAGRRT
jgi:hypothetical protein